LNKLGTFIAALLLANLVLVGALHFMPHGQPPAPVVETPLESPPEEVGVDLPAVESVSVVETPLERSSSELRDWARQAPRAALAWAAQQPDGADRDEVCSAACFQIAQADPAQAVALAEKFSLTNHATLANLVQQWAEQDMQAAFAWADAKSPAAARAELFERIALVWSQTDPANAASLVVERIAAGPEQEEAAISVLHQWALRDLPGAMAWVRLFPEGNLRDRALGELAGAEKYQMATAAQPSP
jgi:hypothetical protein